MNATADQKTILLAASESSERQAAVDTLVAVNCDVVTAAGLSQTSARLSSRTFDLVLLDLDLPNHAGWRIAQYLSNAHNYLPVIEANRRPNERLQTSMLGIDAVVTKPFGKIQLVQAVRDLLDLSEKAQLGRMLVVIRALKRGDSYSEVIPDALAVEEVH
jgi:DNA-binding response OmpR family regulator